MLHAPENLVTERLTLRHPSLSDAEALYEFGRDPLVTRFMDWPTHADIRTAIEFLEGCPARWSSGEEFYWVITVKPDDTAVGGVSCRVRGHAADFGFVLNRRYWRHGYATEAPRAVVDWAESIETIRRIWATCDTENAASARVLEKLGLAREGTLRCWTVRPNISLEPRDAFVYAKVRER